MLSEMSNRNNYVGRTQGQRGKCKHKLEGNIKMNNKGM